MTKYQPQVWEMLPDPRAFARERLLGGVTYILMHDSPVPLLMAR